MNKILKKISYCRFHYNNNEQDILYSKINLCNSTISYRLINSKVFGFETTITKTC
jgi:hypothetical protein